MEEAKTAARWLQARAQDFSIDPDRIVFAGDSSGGHTALMVHATQDLDHFDDTPGQPLDVAAFVDFYGPTDLTKLNDEPTTMDHTGPDSPEGRLFGGVALPPDPELVSQANPSRSATPTTASGQPSSTTPSPTSSTTSSTEPRAWGRL